MARLYSNENFPLPVVPQVNRGGTGCHFHNQFRRAGKWSYSPAYSSDSLCVYLCNLRLTSVASFAVQKERIAHFEQDCLSCCFLSAIRVSAVQGALAFWLRFLCSKPLRFTGPSFICGDTAEAWRRGSPDCIPPSPVPARSGPAERCQPDVPQRIARCFMAGLSASAQRRFSFSRSNVPSSTSGTSRRVCQLHDEWLQMNGAPLTRAVP